ncbi:uncharacterized protein LOC109831066 [Asparagus officinalis]|uniref:uncharacterized protein LOC109831066 n=1 Tax=Asparagus officinalis TaxID=4686 RepID=UPI00098E75D5|nr:uncharacterized protein LOC109831066 [Asparagus officinalis]
MGEAAFEADTMREFTIRRTNSTRIYFCIVEQIEPTPKESDYYTWYWRITRRWILHATTSPVELQRGYVPRGIDERELVSAIDDVQTIANRGLELARAGTYPEAQKHASIYQSIMQRLHQALHRTHEDLHDGREVAQLVYTRQQRHRRGRRRNDNEAGPSQRVDDGAGPSQPQTQPDHELIKGRDRGGRRKRRRRRVLGCMELTYEFVQGIDICVYAMV